MIKTKGANMNMFATTCVYVCACRIVKKIGML